MSGINIEKVDHIGIRVHDFDRALAFYQVLGFKLVIRVTFDPVAIIRNEHGVEINLILNADPGDPEKNVLMDLGDKIRRLYPRRSQGRINQRHDGRSQGGEHHDHARPVEIR